MFYLYFYNSHEKSSPTYADFLKNESWETIEPNKWFCYIDVSN